LGSSSRGLKKGNGENFVEVKRCERATNTEPQPTNHKHEVATSRTTNIWRFSMETN